MTSERPPSFDGEAYLDGLAGREGASPEAREGERLRAALLDAALPQAPGTPPWAAAAEPVQPVRAPEAPEAANDAHPARQPAWRWAMAAAVVLGVGLIGWPTWHSRDQDNGDMRGSGGSAAVVWIQEDPKAAAEALATTLRAAGATVRVDATAEGAEVSIDVPLPAPASVVDRLQALEAGLDSRGHAAIRVRRPQP